MSVEGDIVLIHYQGNPTMYARIEKIEPDIKKDWYHVTLLLLTIPHQQIITWILKEEYINGAPFTMGGNAMMLKKIKGIPPVTEIEGFDKQGNKIEEKRSGKIIPFKSDSGKEK